MVHDVSSAFIADSQRKIPQGLARRFTIGGSDYTAFVEKWPTIKVKWDDPRPTNISMSLDNSEHDFEFFREDKTKIISDCIVSISFANEWIDVWAGKSSKVSYIEGKLKLNLKDKFNDLSQRKVGTSESPAVFSGSTLLPSDIAYILCTSYGGYSAIQSDSNPDIDWQAFQVWADVFSSDSVFMSAQFEGSSVTEALRRLARQTQSAIFIKNNLLSFHRFSIADSYTTDFNPSIFKKLSISIDNDAIINQHLTFADYDVTSKFYKITGIDTASVSVDSYGLRESLTKDPYVWFVDSVSANNLSQRMTTIYADPPEQVSINGPLIGIERQVGEMITLTDSFHGIGDTYRIMTADYDIDKGSLTFGADKTQVLGAFILDSSELDGTDVLI